MTNRNQLLIKIKNIRASGMISKIKEISNTD